MALKNNYPGRILKGTKTQPTLKSASGIWTLDEALQYHRANQWPIPNLYQPISNSLRLSIAKYSSLQKFTNRPSAGTRWTYSIWLKKSINTTGTGNWQELLRSYSPEDAIRIASGAALSSTAGDTLEVYFSGATYLLYTGAVFRDPAAWYHFVVAFDSNQATAANRVKIYVNGVQLTSFQAGATYPPQGYISGLAVSTTGLAIGSIPTQTQTENFDGQVAEVNFIDGYALQPTLFGQFDSNNTWVPIPYTGSYGTNGFYLPFTNAQTSQTLGYDASLNGTPTYGADQDPYRGSVALHLTGNGPTGGNNNTFVDSSSNNLTVTRSGSPTQGSFSPFPFSTNTAYNPAVHSGSVYFNSTTSDYLAVASNAANSPAGGAFTMECWVYLTGSASGNFGIAMAGTANSNPNAVGFYTSNYSTIYFYDGSTSTSMGAVTTNTWYHLAASRVSTAANSTYLYVNGALVSTITLSSTFVSPAPLYIGTSVYGYINNAERFTGYVSNFRLTKGSAIYTSAFTPMMKPFGTLTNNLITFSEDFTNSGWGKDGGISVTPNYGIAPDGTPSMTLMSRAAGTLGNWAALTWAIFVGTGNNAGKTYTFSVWVQATSGTVGGSIAISDVSYNTSTVAFTATTTAQRVSLTYNGPSGVWNASSAYIGGGVNLASVGTSVLVWGAQLEVAGSATNYTPTPANYSTAPSLLLNFANAAIVDSTGSTNVTTYGAASITAASKFGSGALSFTGASGTYLSFPGANFAFGTNPFTIEFWTYLNSTSGNLVDLRGLATNGITPTLYVTSGSLRLYVNSADVITSNTPLTTGVWYHIALCRISATTNLFVNGQIVGTLSDVNSYIAPNFGIVGISAFDQATNGLNGYIDDLRITKGVARYPTAFTPPARALPEVGGKSFVTVNVNAGVVKSFTTVGTTSWTAPTDVTQIEVLVVAGGGGGGGVGNSQGGGGGGGGAGGLLYNNQYPVTPGQTYTILVGAGGTAGPGPGTTGQGGNGGNSQFGNLIAIGGGGGDDADRGHGALSGGSGGGGGGGGAGGRAGASGTPGQGFSGTTGYGSGQNYPGGGGGGAGGVGSTPTASAAGGGGAGLGFGISGTYQYYAGGGGGGINTTTYGSPTLGAGGSGVGGNGGVNSIGLPGTNGTGGGGGAGGGDTGHAGGAGGSGIVLVRYTTNTIGNTSDSTTDNLVDSPTLYGHDFGNGGEVVGNYATLNPLWSNQVNYLNGNLTVTPVSANSGYCHFISSIAMPSTGYWYAEFTIQTLPYPSGNNNMLGIVLSNATANAPPIGTYFGYNTTEYAYLDSGSFRTNNTTSQTASAWAANDVIMVALGNGNVWFGRNGVWQGSGSPNPATATSPAYTGLSGNYQFAGNTYGGGYGGQISANFGQRAWQYTPPQGFSALTLKNFPRPTGAAATPNQYFDTVLYTGNGTNTANSLTITGLNFQPDLIWIKNRGTTDSHWIQDTVRGLGYALQSNTTSADAVTGGGDVSSTTSNGFIISYANTRTNASSNNYVAWCWRANGAAVSNTNGTVTSQVSANTTAGFSIVSYTGTGVQATVGHGLGATPSFIILKNRTDGTRGWPVWHTALGTAGYMYLNSTQASATDNSTWGTMTSTTFGLGNGTTPNTSWNETGSTFVAYCWTAIPGFSAFGSYAANGSADGPFVYTGFKPRWIMMKRYDTGSAENWFIVDTARDPSNYGTGQHYLLPASSAADGTGTAILDVLSNGFKLRSTATNAGAGGPAYIYAAFASAPLTNTNGTAF